MIDMGFCQNLNQGKDLVIRKADAEDVYTAAKINYENWMKTYQDILPEAFLAELTVEKMEQDLKNYLLEGKKGLLVCCEGTKILGFASYEEDKEIEDCRYLASLHVISEARGQGIGTKLIRKVGSLSRRENYGHLSICILVENQRAGSLYRKLGAEHYQYFQDDFHGVATNSEKLWWKNLEMFED